MVKKVHIFGEFDSDNVGDQLIGVGVKIAFEAADVEAHVFPLKASRSSSQEYVKGMNCLKFASGLNIYLRRLNKYYRKKSLRYRRFADFATLALRFKSYREYARCAVADADIIVIGGGQLIARNTMHLAVQCWIIAKAARDSGKAIMVVGVGVGEPYTNTSRFVFKKFFATVAGSPIFVRDDDSARIVDRLLPPTFPRAKVLPDNAIVAVDRFKRVHSAFPVHGTVGLAPLARSAIPDSFREHQINSDEWWTALAAEFVSLGMQPILFCSGSQPDFERCEFLQRRLDEQGVRVRLLTRPQSVSVFLKQLQQLEYVLCQRLHISISFVALGQAPTSVAWDRKVDSFYKSQGLGHRVIHGPYRTVESTCGLVTTTEPTLPDAKFLSQTVIDGISAAVRSLPPERLGRR